MEQLNEIGLSRLNKHTEDNRPLATISGFRYQDDSGKVLSIQENRARNAQIESELKRQNFGFMKVKGAYIEKDKEGNEVEVAEESFLVIGERGRGDAVKALVVTLGKKFGQDSILYRDDDGQAQLIATRADSFVGPVGTVQKLGRFIPKRIGDYYTKLKGDRKFTFKTLSEEFEPKQHLGFSDFRALSVIREVYLAENAHSDWVNQKNFKIRITLKPFNTQTEAEAHAERFKKSHKISNIDVHLLTKSNETYIIYAICPDRQTFKKLQQENAIHKVEAL